MNNTGHLSSYLRIRKLIGLLGMVLPILVVIIHGSVLSSISHYYYTDSAVFFIGILSALGLFLVSYRGRKKDPKKDKFSDNTFTNIGGWAVLIVVLVPTSFGGSLSTEIDAISELQTFPMFGHNNSIYETIHFVFAGLFLASMGWMSFRRFLDDIPAGERIGERKLYKVCGLIIWSCLVILFFEFLIGLIPGAKNQITPYDIFIFETIAVIFFGFSWFVKGKALKDLENFRQSLITPRNK